MEQQIIPDGYKKTEVGVIPEDWEVVTLDDAANFLDGQRRPVKSGDRAKMQGIYPYYGASGIVDYVNDYIFDGEYILLGEDGENILSRNLPLAFKGEGKIWVNNHAHIMQPKIGFHIDYLREYLESLDYSLLNSGTAQPKLNKQSCLNINVIKPTKKEQTAIANALSDVDALIASIEKLITKKQAIKTATMQQLLTGKKRLPPFDKQPDGTPKPYKQTELGEIPEDWNLECFGSLVNYIKGYPFKSAEYTSDGVRIIRVSDTTYDSIHNKNPVYISENDVKQYKKWELKENDLIFSTVGSKPPMYDSLVGKSILINAQYRGSLLNQNAVLIRAKNYSKEIQVLLLNHFRTERYIDHIEIIYRGNANQASITLENLFEFHLPLPSCEEEVKAISNVFIDMDKEIGLLEERLTKTQQIKQGMMQELLTGKTRLPVNRNEDNPLCQDSCNEDLIEFS